MFFCFITTAGKIQLAHAVTFRTKKYFSIFTVGFKYLIRIFFAAEALYVYTFIKYNCLKYVMCEINVKYIQKNLSPFLS